MTGSINNYAPLYQRNPEHLKKIRPNIGDLRDILKAEDSLLDAGCCEGHLYETLAHEKYAGIDIFPPNITKAKLRHPDADFRVGDILNLKSRWDVVFCCRVLMHLPDYEQNIERLKNTAKRLLIVVVPIGQEHLEVENIKGASVEFRTYSEDRIRKTNPSSILKRHTYSTVIYDPRLS